MTARAGDVGAVETHRDTAGSLCFRHLILVRSLRASGLSALPSDTLVLDKTGLMALLDGPAAIEHRRRRLSAWEELRLLEHAAQSHLNGSSAALGALRRLGMSAVSPVFTLPSALRTYPLVQALHAYEMLLTQNQLMDAWEHERLLRDRLTSGPLPSSLANIRSVRLLPELETVGQDLLWIKALGHRFESVRVEVAYNPDAPERTAYAEQLTALIEAHAGERAELVFTGERPPETRSDGATFVVRHAAQGEPCLEALIEQLYRWRASGATWNGMAVILPSNPWRTKASSCWHPAMQRRLLRALGQADIPVQTQLKERLAETSAGRMLFLVLTAARGLIAPESDRAFDMLQLADLLDAFAIEEMGSPQQIRTSAEALRRLGPRSFPLAALAQGLRELGVDADLTLASVMKVVDTVIHPLSAESSVEEQAKHLWELSSWLAMPPAMHEALGEALSEHLLCVRQAARWGMTPLIGEDALSDLHRCLQTILISHSGRPGGITLVSAEQAMGRSFAHVAWFGANQSLSLSLPAPGLSSVGQEAVDPVLRRCLPLASFFPSEHASHADARTRWIVNAIFNRTSHSFLALVLLSGDEQADAPADWVQDLDEQTEHVQADALPVSDQLSASLSPHVTSHRLRALGSAGQRNSASWWQGVCDSAQPQSTIWALARRTAAARRMDAGLVDPLTSQGASDAKISVVQMRHSPSRLDELGVCKFRFFARSLLGLRTESIFERGVDRRAAGSRAHRALELCYRTLLSERPWSIWQREPDTCVKRAQKWCEQAIPQLIATSNVHPSLSQAEYRRLCQLVTTQLHIDLRSSGEPIAFEVPFFGSSPSDGPLHLCHPTDPKLSLTIRGSIDRLERRGEALVVVDYKSSKQQRTQGRHFQLGLYQWAAFSALGYTASASGAAWMVVGSPGKARRFDVAELSGAKEELLSRTQKLLWARLDAVLAGDIAPDPEPPKACVTCDFSGLCRIRQTSDVQDSAEQELS